jgi:hypothetical protein
MVKAAPKQVKEKVTPDSDSDLQPTPISAWKKVKPPITLPSGKVMRIRSVGFQAFLKAGIVPNSLMSIVESAVNEGNEPEVNDLVGDSSSLNDMLAMVDEVVVFVALDPEVKRVPKTEKDRRDNILYVDEVDEDDKQFIFGVCTGGTRDVEQFRQQSANVVASVQRRNNLEDKTE